jgi:hypothetical protein
MHLVHGVRVDSGFVYKRAILVTAVFGVVCCEAVWREGDLTAWLRRALFRRRQALRAGRLRQQCHLSRRRRRCWPRGKAALRSSFVLRRLSCDSRVLRVC